MLRFENRWGKIAVILIKNKCRGFFGNFLKANNFFRGRQSLHNDKRIDLLKIYKLSKKYVLLINIWLL